MDCDEKIAFQKQLELYSGLLKKHENAKRNHESLSSAVCQLSKISRWKQPSHSVYKIVKNSTDQLTSCTKYSVNKFHQSRVTNKNVRTELFNEVNNLKAKHELILNKTVKNTNFSYKNTIKTASGTCPVKYKKPDFCSKDILCEAPKMKLDTSKKVSCNSQALIKEIESLTKILKKTSENKCKVTNTSRDSNIMQDKLLSHKRSTKSFQRYAFNKCNLFENKGLFSKNNEQQPKDINSDKNSSYALCKKSSSFKETNLNSDTKRKYIASLSHPNALKLNKYCFKKVDMEKMSNPKTSYSPLRTIAKKSENSVQNDISKPQPQNLTCQDFNLFCDSSKFHTKTLNQDSKLNTTVDPKTNVSKKGPDIICKSQEFSGVSSIRYADSKYKRINTMIHPVISKKNLTLKHASSHLEPSSVKRTKEKVNTKFKVVNKRVSSCVNRKGVLVKNSYGCKENSALTVDKSDPLFKFLNDSTINKLEQDLLALSTTLTATPVLTKNDSKGLGTNIRKMSYKIMPLKNSKAGPSKYKVVHSVDSHSYAIKNRHSFTNLKNIKKAKSKLNVMNKHADATPKSILIKRLFKSKSAIINKNISSTSHSAKMIKYKYLALNKRNLPHGNSILYPKVPLLQSKFKGYSSRKLYSKKNRYQKAYSQKTLRRFYSNGSGKSCKQKLHNGYCRPPVVFIRGLKYSLNSSGKTLRKLPVQGFSKIPPKGVICDKYARSIDSKIKATTPVSANLASRVLHRSITRVLSASTKKRLTKVNSYCMFYNRFGRCNRGVKCTYIHDPSKIAVCTRFLRGTCKQAGCPFSHEITPGKMAICSFYLVGACDKGDCPYRHENLSPQAELCKAFVQGYCPSGKECTKAHILICPKYIQGNCEKGNSCAFPHPPQKKGRKIVPKEMDVKEEGDALLEKVARYFQPNEDRCQSKSEASSAANKFVPKQRRLEEQPSFIPLCKDKGLAGHSFL